MVAVTRLGLYGGSRGPYGDFSTKEADSTAPILTSALGTATGQTTADLQVDTDEANGTLYWVVTQSDTSPSAAQVKAGTDENGDSPDDSGSQSVLATGTIEVSGGATGLTTGTTYYVHFMHEDAATNQSDVLTSASFATTSVDTADTHDGRPRRREPEEVDTKRLDREDRERLAKDIEDRERRRAAVENAFTQALGEGDQIAAQVIERVTEEQKPASRRQRRVVARSIMPVLEAQGLSTSLRQIEQLLGEMLEANRLAAIEEQRRADEVRRRRQRVEDAILLQTVMREDDEIIRQTVEALSEWLRILQSRSSRRGDSRSPTRPTTAASR